MHHSLMSFFRLVRPGRAASLMVVLSIATSGCTAFQLPTLLKPTLQCERNSLVPCQQDVQAKFDAAKDPACTLAIGTRLTRVPGGVSTQWHLVGSNLVKFPTPFVDKPNGRGIDIDQAPANTIGRDATVLPFITPQVLTNGSTFQWTANRDKNVSHNELPYSINAFVLFNNKSYECKLDPIIVNEL